MKFIPVTFFCQTLYYKKAEENEALRLLTTEHTEKNNPKKFLLVQLRDHRGCIKKGG